MSQDQKPSATPADCSTCSGRGFVRPSYIDYIVSCPTCTPNHASLCAEEKRCAARGDHFPVEAEPCQHQWYTVVARYTPKPPGPPYHGVSDQRCYYCGEMRTDVPTIFMGDHRDFTRKPIASLCGHKLFPSFPPCTLPAGHASQWHQHHKTANQEVPHG
jgi:hypothetical protein